eukprot:TCONS_00009928-protein
MACSAENFPQLPAVQVTSRGYDYEVRGDTPRECQCVICHHLLRKAIDLPCGHAFCKRCLSDWENEILARNNNLVCSVCQTPYKAEQHHPNIPIDRMIRDSLDIFCKQRNNGCNWVGKISNYEDSKHLEKLCDYTQAQCKYQEVGCDVEFIRRDAQEHEKSYKDKHQAMLLQAFLQSKQAAKQEFNVAKESRREITRDLTSVQQDSQMITGRLVSEKMDRERLELETNEKHEEIDAKIGTHQNTMRNLETTIAKHQQSSDNNYTQIEQKNSELERQVELLKTQIQELKKEVDRTTVNDVTKRDELRKDMEEKIKSGGVSGCCWWLTVLLAALPTIFILCILLHDKDFDWINFDGVIFNGKFGELWQNFLK